MKILHVMAGGEAGGAEMAYVDLCIAQKQAGIDIIAACRPNKQRNALLREAGIPVHEFPFRKWFDFKTQTGLRRLVKQEKPAIAQCWMSRAAALMPASSPSLPSFVKIARLGGYYDLKYYKSVHHFIGNTPDIRRWLIEDCHVDAGRVTHINNFAELEPIRTPVTKADCDTAGDAFVFLAMARLHPVKGLDTGLRAMTQVPGAVLWIAGDGPDKDTLQTLAAELGIAGRVRFLGWRTDRSALLDACDAVLFPSRYEPFGGTFAQAWAARRPLVTTASQGPKQYVTGGENAMMVDIDDIDGLAAAMRAVMHDSALRDKIVENGYAEFQKQFTKTAVLEAYNTLYQKLAS